jgi:uncharacterized protein
MMKDLVTTIVKAIVDYPNAVEVKEVDGERTTVVELRVAKEDVGKVIGKQGRIAEAIRASFPQLFFLPFNFRQLRCHFHSLPQPFNFLNPT